MGASQIAQFSAKSLVVLYSIVILLVGFLVAAVGVLSAEAFRATWLMHVMPGWASPTLIAVGVLMILFAVCSAAGAACFLKKPQHRRGAIAGVSVCTFLFVLLFSSMCSAVFAFSHQFERAVQRGFADDDVVGTGNTSSKPELNWLYVSLRNAYTTAYVDSCNPTAYFTTTVQTACEEAAMQQPNSTLAVSACADPAYGGASTTGSVGAGYYGLYCRTGPAVSPFTVDHALDFPAVHGHHGTVGFDAWTIIKHRSFGYFMSSACTPRVDQYWDMVAELERLNLTTGIQIPASIHPSGSPTTRFTDCFRSRWWDDDSKGGLSHSVQTAIEQPPYEPTAIDRQPDGSPLTSEQAVFFEGLQSMRAQTLGSPFLSAKMSFCFCAEDGADSRLYNFMHGTILSNVRTVALSLTIFFAASFVAQIYLFCCTEKARQEVSSVINDPSSYLRFGR
jgi:tryptophan-rich sensory protein